MTVNKKAVSAVIAFIVFILAIFFVSNTVVFVPEDQNVCIKQFNRVTKIYTEAGLHFKNPFIETASSIPKNAMLYNLNPSEVLTLDKKSMIVSSYAVWKITDPLLFLKTAVTTAEAENRLDTSIFNAVKNLLSSMDQTNAISARESSESSLNQKITESVRVKMAEEYGIEIVDIQVKQFDLPQDNKEAVYTRMISERAKIAAEFLAGGKEEADIIRNSADKEQSLILSKAKATAEQTKAEGESQYMRTLAEAFRGEERAEFYEFIRSMDALKIAMHGNKTIILPIDSPLTKWFISK